VRPEIVFTLFEDLDKKDTVRKRLALTVMIAGLLAGCTSMPPPYSLPPDAPAARLRSSLEGAHNANESLAVRVAIQRSRLSGSEQLFSVKKSVSTPSGYVRVPARETLVLAYREQTTRAQRCEAAVRVVLEEGKRYNLVGGADAAATASGVRPCLLAVVDESNGKLLPTPR
jgi:hypothetical protein